MHELLDCSFAGDKRYSPLFAEVRVNGINDTIDRHLQSVKRFVQHQNMDYRLLRFKNPDYFVLKGKKFPNNYFDSFNILLWYQYFKEHIELFNLAKTFKKIEDPFAKHIHVTSVEIILKWLIEDGFPAVYNKTKDFRDLLKSSNDFLISNKKLLNCKEDIFIVEVNCQGISHNRIYKELTKEYPLVKEQYKTICKNKEARDLLGECYFLTIKNKIVCLMFSQFVYSRKTKHVEKVALKDCLFKLKDFAIQNKKSIAIPYGIGCDDSLLDWDVIQSLIEDVFNDYPFILYKE